VKKPSEDRETVIRFGPSEPEIAYLWTTERHIAEKLAKAGSSLKPTHSTPHGSQWVIPRKLITLRAKVPTRNISSENPAHLQAARARKGIVGDRH
jgi:hypothetical protein